MVCTKRQWDPYMDPPIHSILITRISLLRIVLTVLSTNTTWLSALEYLPSVMGSGWRVTEHMTTTLRYQIRMMVEMSEDSFLASLGFYFLFIQLFKVCDDQIAFTSCFSFDKLLSSLYSINFSNPFSNLYFLL